MRVLFDQGTPVPLRRSLPQHDVATVYERGWSTLGNGELLDAAEQAGFGVFVTTDRNLKHQQDLSTRRIAIVALGTTDWRRIQRDVAVVVRAVDPATPGSYAEVAIA